MNNIDLIQSLRDIGLSRYMANYLYAYHMSRGTLDILMCLINAYKKEKLEDVCVRQ